MKDMIPAWVNGKLNPVEKLDVHVRGLRHKAISVFVLDGDIGMSWQQIVHSVVWRRN